GPDRHQCTPGRSLRANAVAAAAARHGRRQSELSATTLASQPDPRPAARCRTFSGALAAARRLAAAPAVPAPAVRDDGAGPARGLHVGRILTVPCCTAL